MKHRVVWSALLAVLPGCTDSSWSTGPIDIEPSCNRVWLFGGPEVGGLDEVETDEGCFLGCPISGDWAPGAEGEVTFRAPLRTGEPLSVSSSDDALLAVEQMSQDSDDCVVTARARFTALGAGEPDIVISRGGTVVDRFRVAIRVPAAVVLEPSAPSWSRPDPALLCLEPEPRVGMQASVHEPGMR